MRITGKLVSDSTPAAPSDSQPQVPAKTSKTASLYGSDAFEAAKPSLKTKLTPTTVAPAGEPALAKLDDGTMPIYTPMPGSPFVGPPKPGDVAQGDLGDCFFLSSLASLAQRQPQALENAITTNPDGSYNVRLFQAQKDGSAKPVTVHVDNEIPEEKGQPAYVEDGDSTATWPEIMEKAYAQLDKGYTVLNKGGFETNAITALTGKPATSSDVTPQTANAVYDQLSQAVSSGKLTTAGTYTNSDLKKALTQYQGQGTGTLDPKTFTYAKFGLVDGHAYTVLGVSDQNGQKMVELRNPWGQTEPTADGDGKDDGVFTLPLSQFAQLFEEVSVGG